MPSASSRRAGSAAPRGRSNGSSSLRKSWATSGSAPHGSGWGRAPCSPTSSASSSTSSPVAIRPRTATRWYDDRFRDLPDDGVRAGARVGQAGPGVARRGRGGGRGGGGGGGWGGWGGRRGGGRPGGGGRGGRPPRPAAGSAR